MKGTNMDRHTITAQMQADLDKGWWIWRSPNKVEHLVDKHGKCATCGYNHGKYDWMVQNGQSS